MEAGTLRWLRGRGLNPRAQRDQRSREDARNHGFTNEAGLDQ